MISIIICSTHHDIDEGLKDNIKTTIGDGVDYEIVCIDNSGNRYSIFSAYDEGVKRAKGDYLCFMHEDVTFHSADWGGKCERQLKENPRIGMLGVLGGYYMSRLSCNWVSSGIIRGQLIQGYVKGKHNEVRYSHTDYNHYGNDVVAIDGLWMFIRRNLFGKYINWDTKNYSGFHFYDTDMSMQIVQSGYKIAIADIMVEHKSTGCFNRAFWDNYLVFHTKWRNFLPVMNQNVTQADLEQADYKEMKDYYLSKSTNLELQHLLDLIHFYPIYGLYSNIKHTIKGIGKHLDFIRR